MSTKPQIVKCVLLGSSGVGKSSIIYRYVTNGWDENVQATLGAAFMDKQVTFKGQLFKFQIWDTAGQEKYAPLAQMYYKDATVALLVYDITSKESFNNLKMWQTQLEEKGPKNVILTVLGNKYDLVSESEVSSTEGEAFAKGANAQFYKTSAKENVGVHEAFEAICEELYKRMNDSMSSSDSSRKRLGTNVGGKSDKKCC